MFNATQKLEKSGIVSHSLTLIISTCSHTWVYQMPKACWEPIPLPAGMHCILSGLFFIWKAMKEHPQPFDKKRWKPANTTGIFWEQARTLCVHLFSHKQGNRQEDTACESHAYLGQYHWGIIYYCGESACTSSFYQEGKLTVSLSTWSKPHRLTRNFVTKCSSPLEEVMCFTAQWYNFFPHRKWKEIQHSGGADQQARGPELCLQMPSVALEREEGKFACYSCLAH